MLVVGEATRVAIYSSDVEFQMDFRLVCKRRDVFVHRKEMCS